MSEKRGNRPGPSTSTDKTAIVLVIAALLFALVHRGARAAAALASGGTVRTRVRRPSPTLATAPPVMDHRGAAAAEELAGDRRFERSLIFRELAVILMIAVLIVGRELLS